jgi:mycothiol synthase
VNEIPQDSVSPLSQRVRAPHVVAVPATPGLEWRPASVDDIDAVTELMQDASRVDHPHYLQTREETEEDLTASYVDCERDTIVGVDAAGRIRAYGTAQLGPSQDMLLRTILFGAVHPDLRGRGIGRQLAAWLEQRALQQLAASEARLPGWIMTYHEDTELAAIGLFERRGFVPVRYYFQLQRPLDEPILDVQVPEGVTLRTPTAADAEAVRLAKNDSFQDHWGSLPMNEEQWGRLWNSPAFRPDLSVIAVTESGEVAGLVLTEVVEADWPGQGFSSGYIELVGVPRAHRGKRIAPAMLTEALRLIGAAGLDKAVLDVDSESLTGAVELYERVGFRQASRSRAMSKVY